MRAASVLLAAVAVLVSAGCGSARQSTPPPPRPLRVYVDGVKVTKLPPRLVIVHDRARIVVAIPLRRARRVVRRARAARRARIDVPFHAVSSSIRIRPVLQVLRDNCEATSLSMLLTAAGVHVGQLRLQAELPISGPLDPKPVPGSSLLRWGDPEQGFVGPADGSGPYGGFGVYEPPIRHLAARYGVRLTDLHGTSVGKVRAAVLAGNPVLAWVGLSAGPYSTWIAPSGQTITFNSGEHAIVLVGAGPGYVLVNNPLNGARERWSESLFSYRWQLLGRRALELS